MRSRNHDLKLFIQVLDHNFIVFAAEFPIQRPWYLLYRFEHDPSTLERIHILGIHLLNHQCSDDFLQFDRILRCLNQCHFKNPVIESDLFSDQITESSDGSGICNHSIYEFIFDHFIIMCHLHLI